MVKLLNQEFHNKMKLTIQALHNMVKLLKISKHDEFNKSSSAQHGEITYSPVVLIFAIFQILHNIVKSMIRMFQNIVKSG